MLGVMSMVKSNPRNGIAGLSPNLASFMHQLPEVNGNPSDMVDMVISILLQSDIPSDYFDRTTPLIPQFSSAFPASSCARGSVSSLRNGTLILNGSNVSSYKADQGCGYFMNSSIPKSIQQSNVVESEPLQGDERLKNSISPSLASFITHLPAVNGPSPDVDRVISVLLQSDIPSGSIHSRAHSTIFRRPNSNGQIKTSQPHKRKRNENDKEEEAAPEKPAMDIFRLRQIKKLQAMAVSQSGSTSSSVRS